jgi:ankyrin repeat protein
MKVFIFQEQLVASKGPAEDTALHLAARKGDNDLVKFFIEAGAKVDAQTVSTESKT